MGVILKHTVSIQPSAIVAKENVTAVKNIAIPYWVVMVQYYLNWLFFAVVLKVLLKSYVYFNSLYE